MSGNSAVQRRAPVLLLAGLGIAMLIVLGRASGHLLPAFAAWIDVQRAWAPMAFVAGYVVAVVALVPGAPLTLLGGAALVRLLGLLDAADALREHSHRCGEW